MKRLLFISVCLLSVHFIHAQTTGKFTLNVTFSQSDYNVNRNLYFYVPTDYDVSQSYKLVVGFRGGPHSDAGQFRDQLSFLSDSLGAIILCPENAHHFNNNEGLVKKLFNYSVDTASTIYNIDPEFIYLTGLSYGGRHAVIVSMDTDAGPIPNLRGVIPFAAGSNADMQPDYGAVSDFPPACICIGLSDNNNFINVSRTLHQDISDNNGTSMLNEIPGVGHTVVFPTYPHEMAECFDFIENQYSGNKELYGLSTLGVRISPNPVNDVLTIARYKGVEIEKFLITSLDGRIVREVSGNTRTVQVNDVTSGTYLFIAINEGQLFTEKFIVQK